MSVSDFFRKYNAVPATDAGPSWRETPEAALLAEFDRLREIVRVGWDREAGREATAAERKAQTWLWHEVAAELKRRAGLEGASGEVLVRKWLWLS